MYCAILLVLTILIAGLIGFGHHLLWRSVGAVLTGVFAAYIATIAWTIAKGIFAAPELSDSDGDSSSDSDEDQNESTEVESGLGNRSSNIVRRRATTAVPDNALPSASSGTIPQTSETGITLQAIRPDPDPSLARPSRHSGRSRRHSLLYHLSLLGVGFVAILLSAYVLSTAATNLVDEFGISDVLFGIVILSIATTLPEKFIAVMSSSKGHAGIMVANTVGSNIFLLSLVIGVLWLSTGGEYDEGSTNAIELGVMVGSTVAMALIVWLDLSWSRWLGAAMLVAYVAFLVLEFTTIRKV